MLRMFGSKRGEVTGDWDTPYNKGLHIFASHHVLGLSNQGQRNRRGKWQVQGTEQMHIGYWWEKPNKKTPLEDTDVEWKIILNKTYGHRLNWLRAGDT